MSSPHDRECEARIVVATPHANALASALEPDNTTAPPGIMAKCIASPDRLECVVKVKCSTPLDVLRLRNTIDDLLVDLRAALESLEGAGQADR